MPEPMLNVHYLYEPDEVWTFPVEGERVTFGRDDSCDITIFSAINGNALSRVAGRIWRMENELWVRNLSERHDLDVEVPGQAAGQPLRQDDLYHAEAAGGTASGRDRSVRAAGARRCAARVVHRDVGAPR